MFTMYSRNLFIDFSVNVENLCIIPALKKLETVAIKDNQGCLFKKKNFPQVPVYLFL